jgi:hypothetical protein
LNQKDGTRALRSNQTLSCNSVKDGEGKKPKPVREESFSSKLVFEKNDFRYIDKIVDPNRRKRDGPKGYPPSSIFTALLLMYLKSMESVLELVRFLNSNPDWLVTLNLKKKIKSQIRYKVPDRSTFYKFARRLGPGKIVDIFSVMVVELMRMRVIKSREEKVSLDCSIIHTGVVLRLQACKQSQTQQPQMQKAQTQRQRCFVGVGSHPREVRLWL